MKFRFLTILFTIFFTSSCSFFSEKEKAPHELSFELSHSLFSTLDPLLGYAHNIKYQKGNNPVDEFIGFEDPEQKRLENGFSVMEMRDENKIEKPVVIVVLGASTSDPYMFKGNWPFQLHKILSEKKVAHVIYNGSVSGYNSFQNLTKLERDVFNLSEKADYVIYMGPNDSDAQDVVNDHSSIHPFQEYIYRKSKVFKAPNLLDPEYRDDYFLVKTMKSYLNLEMPELQKGPLAKDNELNSFRNVNYMNLVSRFHGATFFHIMELYMEFLGQKEVSFLTKYQNAEEERMMTTYLRNSKKLFVGSDFSKDFQAGLPHDLKIFYDFAHKNQTGNRWIAVRISDLILQK